MEVSERRRAWVAPESIWQKTSRMKSSLAKSPNVSTAMSVFLCSLSLSLSDLVVHYCVSSKDCCNPDFLLKEIIF